MNSALSPEFAYPAPLTADWTIVDLLEWIGADDERCHDERLTGILDAVLAALSRHAAPRVVATPVAGSVVAQVRAVARSVAADPVVGERTLRSVVASRPATSAGSREQASAGVTDGSVEPSATTGDRAAVLLPV